MTKITSMLKMQTLITLSRGKVHGYELMKTLSHIGKRVSPSQVYPFLKELEHKKHLTVKKGERGRKEYQLTAKGKQFVHTITTTYNELLDAYIQEKVTQCGHCNCQIYKGGVKKKIRGTTHTYCCEHCAGHGGPHK